MKGKGIIFLLVALVLPSVIFVFLKMFGKNEFAVEPLFQEQPKENIHPMCGDVVFPYHVPDSALQRLAMGQDSIALVMLGEPDKNAQIQLKRMDEELAATPVRKIFLTEEDTPNLERWSTCVFLLPGLADIALIDNRGRIRGQYTANDREEMDRLLTELTIILKKY